MFTASILCLLIGSLLGMRLNVLALLPTIVLSFFVIGGGGALRGDDFGLIGLLMVLAATGLQMGYLAGSAHRWMNARPAPPVDREAIRA